MERSRASVRTRWVLRARGFPRVALELREHYMRLREEGPKPGDMGGDPSKGDADPLNRFARMINMHDWDETSLAWQKIPAWCDRGDLVGTRS